jgi:hypothetical protein
MGTHNLLLRLGEAMFLEVIAVNPNAQSPSRPRWFQLDQPWSACESRLACWVARTDDIHAVLAGVREPLGTAEPMFRGASRWLISILEDGRLPLGGVAPALIEWQTHPHPAAGLQDMGCRLVTLELLHPDPETVRAVLDDIKLVAPEVVLSVRQAGAPGLVAHIDTPHGLRRLG